VLCRYCGTPYRLIGFPSYSFKNREPGFNSNITTQERQFDTFHVLLDQAHQAGKKVRVVGHIPLIDDPYALAQLRYTAKTPKDPLDPNAKATRSPASTWNVSKKLSDGWADAIASDTVAGVFGHLYDSHKEIYRQPYTWSNVTDHKTGMAKLYIAPPLSVNNQDTSPIQARGFALAGLKPDSIKYTIYWYDSEHKDFAPDKADENARPNRLRAPSTWEVIKNGVARIVCCAWQYLCPTSIEQAATLFIALLAAFLTIVQVWQIPPAANLLRAAVLPPAPTNPTPQAGVNQPSGVQPAAKSAFDPSPFASNFGKTVITGLGGLLAETALKSFEGDTAKAGDKQFYIVWFILLFFALLISSALLRAFVEAVRARIAIIHYPLVRPSSP